MLRVLRMLTAGESHGQALVGVLEGVPAGLSISAEEIGLDLRRRQGGHGRGGRMKIEKDRAAILSGVRHGVTIGSPIALEIQNRDWANWSGKMSVEPPEGEVPAVTRVRPGHADLAGALKYDLGDVRNVLERASARETAMRVGLGSVCRRFLSTFGIEVRSHTVTIGGVRHPGPAWVRSDRRGASGKEAEDFWQSVETSPVRCGDASATEAMVQAIDSARLAKDTLGGTFEVVAYGLPIGLGSHVHWDRKLSTRLAAALMSVNSAKAVEIGDGIEAAGVQGSAFHDVLDSEGADRWSRLSNHAGGIEGGMSNGEPVVARCTLKPIPTLMKPLPSVDRKTGEPVLAAIERSDVCVVPAGGVVGEAMVALVLADAFLEKFGGDSVREIESRYREWVGR